MSRYIDADAIPYCDIMFPKVIKPTRYDSAVITEKIHNLASKEDIDKMPTEDVVKLKHGKWVYRDDGRYHRTRAYCTNCGLPSGIGGIRENQAKPYCPNCGARMYGGKNGTI